MAEAQKAEGAGSLPSAEEARGWAGFRLDEMGGSSIGRVQGIYVDSESGAPGWVVVKLGRFGRVTVVPFRDCAAGAGHVWTAHERDTISDAPVLRHGELTREEELEICAHYGIGEDEGRAAQIAARPEGATTSELSEPSPS